MKKFLLTFLSVGIVLASLLPTTVALAVRDSGDRPQPVVTFVITAPAITATAQTNLTTTTASLNSTITDDGTDTAGCEVSWGYGTTSQTAGNFASYDTVTAFTGAYSVNNTPRLNVTGLLAETTYYYRVQVKNSDSTVTSTNEISFTTLPLTEFLSTGGDADSDEIYGVNWTAMQFTSSAVAHTVTTIRVEIKRVLSPGEVTLSLRTATSGLPSSTDYMTFTAQNGNTYSTAYNFVTFTIDPASPHSSLEGNTQYAIVLSAVNGDASNYILWHLVAAGSLANAVSSHSVDNGFSFVTDSPKDALFQVRGEAVISIVSANVFQDYITSGDLLFATEAINNYPPYAPISDSTQYFNVQLLDTDGLTVLASSPLRMWGDKPASVYLGASSASQLTVGAAYYIAVVGNFSPYPSAMYQLVAQDWRGSNKSQLYNWVINTANNMNDYWGVTGTAFSFTSNVVGGSVGNSQVISDFGNPVFATGIIGLETVLPSVFATTHSTPDLPLGTDQSTYDSAYSWTTQVGSQIVSDANAVADLFGIPSGANAIGYGIALAMVIVMVIVMGSGGTALTGIILSSPLLLLGNYYRVISIQITVVFLVICTLLFIRQLWLKIF